MRRFLRNNGLSLTLGGVFWIFWCGQAWSGWLVYNEDKALHGGKAIPISKYLATGHFWQATCENWESEFLQMGSYVILTAFLFQKGSAESNDPDEPSNDGVDSSRGVRRGFFYRNSLSLALCGLFVVSFAIHVYGSLVEFNDERAEHRIPGESLWNYMSSSELWFQSFQNWQSEYLAVLMLVILTIFLRQEGSPESKSINDPNSKTGK